MTSPQSHRMNRHMPWVMGCLAFAMGIGSFLIFNKAPETLFSSPTEPRKWADAEFRELTRPVSASGKLIDPVYAWSHSKSGVHSTSADKSHLEVVVKINGPAREFVPRINIVDFDAADGFSTTGGRGRLAWLAARTLDASILEQDQFLELFRSDGHAMPQAEVAALGLTREDRRAWNYERIDGQTTISGMLGIEGIENAQWKFRQVFDAATHVPLATWPTTEFKGTSLKFRATLAAAHDAPLVAVIDMAHGKMQEFSCQPSAGMILSHSDFKIEVVDVVDGSLGSFSKGQTTTAGDLAVEYGGSASSHGKAFTVLYQVTPEVLATAVSLEAIDAAGKSIDELRSYVGVIPVSEFDAPISRVASLRFSYRPHFDRLLLRMKSLPGVPAANGQPTNLFDVTVPKMTFYDDDDMRAFVAGSIQFKDVTRSSSYFGAMTVNAASPRTVMANYLASNPRRQVIVDSVAQTIEFIPEREQPLLKRVWDRLRSWTGL